MPIFDKPPHYRSFLLTCWEERSRDTAVLIVRRFSLQEPRTGQRHGFASLEDVIDFLRAELGGQREELPD